MTFYVIRWQGRLRLWTCYENAGMICNLFSFVVRLYNDPSKIGASLQIKGGAGEVDFALTIFLYIFMRDMVPQPATTIFVSCAYWLLLACGRNHDLRITISLHAFEYGNHLISHQKKWCFSTSLIVDVNARCPKYFWPNENIILHLWEYASDLSFFILQKSHQKGHSVIFNVFLYVTAHQANTFRSSCTLPIVSGSQNLQVFWAMF